MARQIDEDDDSLPTTRGILKDGRTHRVSLEMRDGVVTRRRLDDSACHYQPGPVTRVDRSAASEATTRVRESEQAGGPTQTGRVRLAPFVRAMTQVKSGTLQRIEGRLVCVPDDDDDATDAAPAPRRTASLPVRDAATARRAKREAYEAMVAESLVAWKNL